MYQVGLMETDQHIEFFWGALEMFAQEELCKFIKFACNQERIPFTCPCKDGGPDTAHVPPYPMKIAPPDGTAGTGLSYHIPSGDTRALFGAGAAGRHMKGEGRWTGTPEPHTPNVNERCRGGGGHVLSKPDFSPSGSTGPKLTYPLRFSKLKIQICCPLLTFKCSKKF